MMEWLARFLRDRGRAICCLSVRAYLHLWGVTYGKGLAVWSLPLIRKHKGATIQLGSHVTILNRLAENPAGITHRTALVAVRGARLAVGNGVGMSGVILYCTASIVIEDRVQLGAGVKVYDTDFHPLSAEGRRLDKAARTAPVRICEDAWIGAEAVILKGVTIGARSVVAARAVVTKDVPPDTLVAGTPARFIRSLNIQGSPSSKHLPESLFSSRDVHA